jgi:hypothetical protein
MDTLYEESMNEYKEKDFYDAESVFLSLFFDRVGPNGRRNFNRCCNEKEKEMIQKYADKIHKLTIFKPLSFFDIYLTLIFAYYSLHLMEQTEDWLRTYDLKNAKNQNLSNKLYKDVTIGDIIDSEGKNLSSEIRRKFMGLRGGKKSRKRRINKRRCKKSNKQNIKRKTNKRYSKK